MKKMQAFIFLALFVFCVLFNTAFGGEDDAALMTKQERISNRYKKVQELREVARQDNSQKDKKDRLEMLWQQYPSEDESIQKERNKPKNKLLSAKMEDVDIKDFINASDISETGKNVGILELEPEGVPQNDRCIECHANSDINNALKEHALFVFDVIKQVVKNSNLYGDAFDFLDRRENLLNTLPKNTIKIVNSSLGISDESMVNYRGLLTRAVRVFRENDTQSIQEEIQSILSDHSDKLFVFAAGNTGSSYKTELYPYAFSVMKRKNSNYEKNNIIFVVNITSHGVIAESSTRPDSSDRLAYEDTIATYGTDVIDKSTGQKHSGTSFSAPIVSGAAALILERHPDFTPYEIKECLLESADRRVMIPTQYNTFSGLDEYEIEYIDLDIKKNFTYGKGILSVKNAMIYAKILEENREKLKDERKKIFKQVINKQESEAATTIKHHWKKLQQVKQFKEVSKDLDLYKLKSYMNEKDNFLTKDFDSNDIRKIELLGNFFDSFEQRNKNFWNDNFRLASDLSPQARSALKTKNYLNEDAYNAWIRDEKHGFTLKLVDNTLSSLKKDDDQLYYLKNMDFQNLIFRINDLDREYLSKILEVVAKVYKNRSAKIDWIRKTFEDRMVVFYQEIQSAFPDFKIEEFVNAEFEKDINKYDLDDLVNYVESSWGSIPQNKDLINRKIVSSHTFRWDRAGAADLLNALLKHELINISYVIQIYRITQDSQILNVIFKTLQLADKDFLQLIAGLNLESIRHSISKILPYINSINRAEMIINNNNFLSVLTPDEFLLKLDQIPVADNSEKRSLLEDCLVGSNPLFDTLLTKGIIKPYTLLKMKTKYLTSYVIEMLSDKNDNVLDTLTKLSDNMYKNIKQVDADNPYLKSQLPDDIKTLLNKSIQNVDLLKSSRIKKIFTKFLKILQKINPNQYQSTKKEFSVTIENLINEETHRKKIKKLTEMINIISLESVD